jgi:hypothetical protein
VTREREFRPTTPYPGASRVAAMSDAELRERFADTALLRAKPAGLRRNAALALGSTVASSREPA